MKILLVDDNPSDRMILRKVLREIGDLEIAEADSLDAARRALDRDTFDAAIIDLRLGEDVRNRDGHTLVRELGERTTTLPIMWTATREIHEIREAMRNGAYDYIFKDAPHKELVGRVIEGVRSKRSLEREVLELRARRTPEQPVHDLIGDSPQMMRLRDEIRAVALGSTKPALVLGPSGAGKELVARALHALGPHPDAPFIAKNCGAIPESLVESELFGHEESAFTGAKKRAGAFGAVGKGTLFLDEIAEMPLGQQAKLLRAIEAKRFTPVGSDVERTFAGRIVAATHQDLTDRVSKGTFRQDLYMRLSFFPIRLPALREHASDIPAIVEHYLRKNEITRLRFSEGALRDLAAREWPGNVRELEQVIERLAIRPPENGLVLSEHVTAAIGSKAPTIDEVVSAAARELLNAAGPRNAAIPDGDAVKRIDVVEAFTASLYREALSREGNKKARAARLVGTDRRVIERFMKGEPSGEGGDDE